MICLTKLNRTPLAVNADLIKFVENSPDTVVTLLTGEKVIVRETLEEVIAKVIDFRRSLLSEMVFHPAAVRNLSDLPRGSLESERHG